MRGIYVTQPRNIFVGLRYLDNFLGIISRGIYVTT